MQPSPVTKHNKACRTWHTRPASTPALFVQPLLRHSQRFSCPRSTVCGRPLPPRACQCARPQPRPAAVPSPQGTTAKHRLSRAVDCRKLLRRATARGSLNELPNPRDITLCLFGVTLPSFSRTLLTIPIASGPPPHNRFYRLLVPLVAPASSEPLILLPTVHSHARHNTV